MENSDHLTIMNEENEVNEITQKTIEYFENLLLPEFLSIGNIN